MRYTMQTPKIRHIKFHPDNFISGISGQLTPEQIGVYWTICSLIYSKGGAIDNDPKWLANIMGGVSVRPVKRIIAELVFLGKVTETSTKLSVNSCETILKLTQNHIETSSKGGRNSRHEYNDFNTLEKKDLQATKQATTNHKPLTINHKPISRGDDKSSPPKRGTRLPEDWAISDEDFNFAKSKGMDTQLIEIEAEKFRNYWTAKSGQNATKVNWHRTWQNWVLNGYGHKQRINGPESAIAVYQELMDECDREGWE